MTVKTNESINERFSQEDGDEVARAMFSPAELQMAPDEYAARHAHEWGCFSYHLYRYQDPILGAWMRRFGEILFSETELERCRKQYLTPSERAEVERRQAEAF